MSLFINSPSHYTEEYGVDDEIYKMCSLIIHNIHVSSYTDVLDTIGITPMIAPISVLESYNWKEIKYISLNYRMADISLISDYDAYCQDDLVKKKQIILDNIFQSLRVVKKRLRGKFDYEKMENDIKSIVKEFNLNG